MTDCSFCHDGMADLLIAGPGHLFICSECVALACDLIIEELEAAHWLFADLVYEIKAKKKPPFPGATPQCDLRLSHSASVET